MWFRSNSTTFTENGLKRCGLTQASQVSFHVENLGETSVMPNHTSDKEAVSAV